MLAVATFLYVTRVWPHDLFIADEALLLYEGKRVLDGDVMYRDFFEIISPGGPYVVALAYWLFGVSMDTARGVHGATHATIVVLGYLICRTLGVRRTIAIAVGLADIAYAYQALPMTSAHWMGTMLTLVVLLIAVRLHAGRDLRGALALGMSCGVLAAVEHQKVAFVGAAVALLLVLDHLLVPPRPPAKLLARRLAVFAAGGALVVAPLALVFLSVAGVEPVFEALIYHPLVQYRSYNRTVWGAHSWLNPELYVRPDLMQRWPLIVPIVALQFVWNTVRRSNADHIRRPLTLAMIGAGAVGSILYFPDYIHLGGVAPVVFVLVAAWSESVLRVAERWLRVPQLVGSALAMLLWWPMVRQCHENQRIRRQLYPISHLTEFGHIAVKHQVEVELIEAIRQRVRDAPNDNALFCYPGCSSIYLETGTRNPTRFQLLLPDYSTAAHFDEVIADLKRQAVPYVAIIGTWNRGPDPLRPYLHAHYDRVPFSSERSWVHSLWKRRPLEQTEPFF